VLDGVCELVLCDRGRDVAENGIRREAHRENGDQGNNGCALQKSIQHLPGPATKTKIIKPDLPVMSKKRGRSVQWKIVRRNAARPVFADISCVCICMSDTPLRVDKKSIPQNIDFAGMVVIINPLPETGNGGRLDRSLQIR
jgi:hypothetical protein